jgi:hypothetical protein
MTTFGDADASLLPLPGRSRIENTVAICTHGCCRACAAVSRCAGSGHTHARTKSLAALDTVRGNRFSLPDRMRDRSSSRLGKGKKKGGMWEKFGDIFH